MSSPTESGATRTPPARLLYEELASRGVRVCLVGRRVSEGRRALGGGLLSIGASSTARSVFVCVLSKKALGNFEKLEKGSLPCDITTYS